MFRYFRISQSLNSDSKPAQLPTFNADYNGAPWLDVCDLHAPLIIIKFSTSFITYKSCLFER